jgi:uncharacterized protein YjbJ (UPF0337 family)
MGELTDKAKGLGNKVAGGLKSGVADATDDPSLKAEGELQKAKGKLQDVSGEAKGAVGNKI